MQTIFENKANIISNTANSMNSATLACAIKSLTQRYKTMHLNKEMKTDTTESNLSNNRNNSILRNEACSYSQSNSKIDYDEDQICDAKKINDNTLSHNFIQKKEKCNIYAAQTVHLQARSSNGNLSVVSNKKCEKNEIVHKTINSSSNLNGLGYNCNYKDHSSSPILHLASSTPNNSNSPTSLIPSTVNSRTGKGYLSPIILNSNNNRVALSKNSSCLHVPQLIKSPVLQRVSSITLPAIDINESAKVFKKND